MIRAKLLAACMGVLLLAGSLPVAAEDAAAEELMAVDRAFARASAERGLAGWLEYFADEAAIFPSKGPIVQGLAAVRAHYAREGFSPVGLAWEPEAAMVSAAGDLGFTYGYWRLTAPSAREPSARGKYVTVWKRAADGTWKVVADVGNAEPPPSAAPEAGTP